jgi:uncharacterized membrane protein YkvA (DUF1232 family)
MLKMFKLCAHRPAAWLFVGIDYRDDRVFCTFRTLLSDFSQFAEVDPQAHKESNQNEPSQRDLPKIAAPSPEGRCDCSPATRLPNHDMASAVASHLVKVEPENETSISDPCGIGSALWSKF